MTSASPLHHQQGFTMIEMLIAMLIMTVGVLTTLTMISASMKANTTSNRLTTKTALAQQMVEDLLSMKSSDVVGICPTALTDYNLNMTGAVTGAANYLPVPGSGTYSAKCSSTQLTALLQIKIVVSTVPNDGNTFESFVYRYLE
jgi:prepilin-type N-terminal cleavage/methylation domain-containing protein